MDTTSSDIISKIKQGDKLAFESLFKTYYARLCEYSCMLTKDKDIACEIVQDFFAKLWETRETLTIGLPKPYLFKAVHNNTIKYLDKQKKLDPLTEGLEYGYDLPYDFELTEQLEKSLNELPPRCKEIFILSRIEKLRHQEIADKLGISPRTVETQIRNANQILREKLKEFMPLLFFLFFN